MGEYSFLISDLREHPHFRHTVADRIWNAWWRENGVAFDHIDGLLGENFTSTGIPLALVAHRDGHFLGTASVIESDMEERPQYTPWVAAAWVEPEYRMQGTGSALVMAAAKAALEQGAGTVYLCATTDTAPFYEKLGWRTVETEVNGLTIFSLSRAS